VVGLTGTGALPTVPELTPTSLSLTSAVGTTSQRQVTVTNRGPVSLTLKRPTAVIGADGAAFTHTTTCATTLTPNQSCNVSVTFAPTSVRTYAAALRFVTDAGRRPSDVPPTSTQDVALVGTGTTASQGAGPAPTAPTSAARARLATRVRAVWSLSRGLTKLVSLTVRAPLGSRIDIRCKGKRGACPFATRIITETKKSTTSLTSRFNRKRSMRAGTAITVRVSKRTAIGTFDKFTLRSGRKPKVSKGCVTERGIVRRCP